MLEDSQRLQGFRSCEVAQSYDWSFSKVAGLRRLRGALGYIIHTSKVTRLQGLQGLRGSLSDKFQRYSPSFDIIIIIIILKVDIRGCEVARVSWFRRAISTHITCHIYHMWISVLAFGEILLKCPEAHICCHLDSTYIFSV